jgi:hypothetical protein
MPKIVIQIKSWEKIVDLRVLIYDNQKISASKASLMQVVSHKVQEHDHDFHQSHLDILDMMHNPSWYITLSKQVRKPNLVVSMMVDQAFHTYNNESLNIHLCIYLKSTIV